MTAPGPFRNGDTEATDEVRGERGVFEGSHRPLTSFRTVPPMTESIVDDVLSGRRFPYSRAFARAGFSADDAERWRRAGWTTADDAEPWHRIDTAADENDLIALALEGFEPEQVRQVSRFAPRFTVAWTHALLRPADDPRFDTDLDIDLREIGLRASVRQNLMREHHPIGR